MVIFGAGASHDSFSPPFRYREHEELRPPLAKELFLNRPYYALMASKLPKCFQSIIPNLRRPSIVVEHELENFQMQANGDDVRKSQLAATRFYLQDVIWESQRAWNDKVTHGVTNYKTLLDDIRYWRTSEEQKEPVCLVTFNYDTMLEEALPGVKINALSDYVKSDYKVIKLHGSVNWVHPVNTSISGSDWINEVIERAAELEVGDQTYLMVERGHDGKYNRQYFLPALAIPIQNKRNYECPDEHSKILPDYLPKIHKLLIIGWSATEQNFLQMLSEKLSGNPPVRVVSRRIESANQVVQKLKDAGIKGKFASSEGGFSEFVAQHFADEFLKDP